MRDAYAAFQGDRPGSPGFQLAEDAGFQTQGPRAVLAVEAVVGFAPSSAASGHAANFDLVAVVAYATTSRGPREGIRGGGAWHVLPRRDRADLAIAVVVTWDPSSRFGDADEDAVLAIIVVTSSAPPLHDEEALMTYVASSPRAPRDTGVAWMLALAGEE